MIGLLGSLLAGVVGSFGKLFSVETLKFLAWRAFILFIVFVALPVVFYNVATGLMFDFIQYALDYLSSQGIQSHVFQFTSIGAYIAQKIQLVQAFTVFISFLSIRFIMRFIPFLR